MTKATQRKPVGKGCLSIGRLADVDLQVLQELLALSYAENKQRE